MRWADRGCKPRRRLRVPPAPADGPLTEEAFRRTPLDFEGNSILRWGGDATQLEFTVTEKGWEMREGTTPAGSMWRKNPIPSGLWEREGDVRFYARVVGLHFTVHGRPLQVGARRRAAALSQQRRAAAKSGNRGQRARAASPGALGATCCSGVGSTLLPPPAARPRRPVPCLLPSPCLATRVYAAHLPT